MIERLLFGPPNLDQPLLGRHLEAFFAAKVERVMEGRLLPTWRSGAASLLGRVTREVNTPQKSQLEIDPFLVLPFLGFVRRSFNIKSLKEKLLSLNPEVKEAIISNRAHVMALLTSRPEDTFSLEALLNCDPINQHFIFSQAKDILAFVKRVDLYEDLLVMGAENIEFMAYLISKGFDLEALFQMKVTLDEYGRSIGFSEIARGFAEFSVGALDPSLTDASLMILFIEFIKDVDKGPIFQMLAELKPEVKEAILSNKEEVLALLRSKLKHPGNLQRLLAYNPINQRFVFSHAGVILSHDEMHHKHFLERTMYEKEGLYGGVAHLYGSIYEELLWIEEREILDANVLIWEGFSVEYLFRLKERMNQDESSISFSELKAGLLAHKERFLSRDFQALSAGNQLLVILFTEFEADESIISEKVLSLHPEVRKTIFSNKVIVLDLLRAAISSSFTLKEVLSANPVNQRTFFSLSEIPANFIDPSFYRNVLEMSAPSLRDISYIAKKQEIALGDLFQVQEILAEFEMTMDCSEVRVLMAEISEGKPRIKIESLSLLDSYFMMLFAPFIEEADKRPLFRKTAALTLPVKQAMFLKRGLVLDYLRGVENSSRIEKMLENFALIKAPDQHVSADKGLFLDLP